MNRKLTLLLLLLLGMGGAVSAYNNTYAVIIGVADYKHEYYAKDLPYTLNEAEAVYYFLRSPKGGLVPAENICLLTDSRASRNNILFQAKTLFAKAKKNDRVILYFGGHGGEGFFCPCDYNGFYDSALTYDDIKAIFKCAKCETKLMFADACYSGGIKGNDRKTDENARKIKIKSADNLNVVVMVASKADEFSWQTSKFEMGVFTHFLIEGLGGAANRDGNGYVTIQELYYYVFHKVMEETEFYETQQTPQLFGKFDLRLIVSKVY